MHARAYAFPLTSPTPSRTAIPPRVPENVRTKLAINQPGDEFEQEANRASEKVLQGQAPGGDSRRAAAGLQMEGRFDHQTARTEAPPALQEVLNSTGQPLDANTRAFMESRFQFDFGRVRVHQDEVANRAASQLSARAFALGSKIAFGHGHYAPRTTEGRKLIAHELSHVVQQSRGEPLVLRRAPILKGKSQHEFGESDAPTIDKAIAASGLTKWVPAKNLAKLTGNVDTEDPVVFEKQFNNFGQSNESVDDIPGFVDRSQKKPIKLRLPGRNAAGQLVSAAKMEAAVHETVHLNSNAQFRGDFGHNYNEAVTQYFTEMVLGESGKAYRDKIKLAEGLVATLGEDAVGKAYFQGDKTSYAKIVPALGRISKTGFSDWHKAREKDPPDWNTANTLLQRALSATSQPAAQPPTPPSRPQKTSE
jgi:hypothetical protein